ncbi:MAG: trimeric intracellular cation channel family protein [Oscillospiraceae bacterium]|nr:trimeric intracellular cation channel family protein [Oscillospiraceae bacterium]
MTVSELVLLILEIIGTISFSVSGAMVGIKARLDIFGVVFVSAITAFGGGILRDILIGRTPPAIFENGYMVLLSFLSAIVVFIIIRFKKDEFSVFEERIEFINNFFDAIGLAAFSVMGTEVAFAAGFSGNVFISVTLGMLTGIGGGIFRDVLTDSTPFVFKKHIYAVASIIGSTLYYILRNNFENLVVVSVVPIVVIFSIRMLATKYRWSLPKIKVEK